MLGAPPPDTVLTPPVIVPLVPALEWRSTSDRTPSECVIPLFVSSVGDVDVGR